MSQITIQQAAGQLNLANSDLLWEVTSAQSSSAQFQYVCALQDKDGIVLTTVKQQPNLFGKGVFNLGRIVTQYLGVDYNVLPAITGLTSGSFNKQTETADVFKVAFGEEYSTSTTGSVTSYTGIGTATGSAAYTGSIPFYYWLNGTLNPNSGDWNWATSSYYYPESASTSNTFSHSVALTTAPRTQYVQIGDCLNVGLINGSLVGSPLVAQDIFCAEVKVYNGSTLLATNYAYNVASTTQYYQGGPRVSQSQFWSSVDQNILGSVTVNKSTPFNFLVYGEIGPRELTDQSIYNFDSSPWTSYTVRFLGQDTFGAPNTNGVWDSFTFYKQDPNCGYDGVRFAWINEFGVWDWFNFTLQNTKQTTLDSGLYKKNFVDYSTPTNAVTYDKKRRGTNSYYVNITENYQVNSDWLTQEQADWLETLFYSPNVYIQDGTNFLPINITDTEFVSKTNPRTQKNFQYIVNYTLANNKRSR